MLDALLSFVFEMVLSLVGTAIAKLVGADNAEDFAPVVIGLGFIGIAVAAAIWGH